MVIATGPRDNARRRCRLQASIAWCRASHFVGRQLLWQSQYRGHSGAVAASIKWNCAASAFRLVCDALWHALEALPTMFDLKLGAACFRRSCTRRPCAGGSGVTRSAIAHSCRPSNARGLPCRSWDTPSSTPIYVRASSFAVLSPSSLISLVSRRHPLPRIGDECLHVSRMALRRPDKPSSEVRNRSVPASCGSC